MITINNLSVSFGDHQVLKNISAEFAEARVYGIVGLNGAGKTTFFNALSDTLRVPGNPVTVDGTKLQMREIAYLESVNYFYSGLTGKEYLGIFRQTNPGFNLESLQGFLKLPLDELIETYSTGMKKKLALLGILKQNRRVFLLDEPFNSLDLETNKVLELIITSLKEKGKTVYLSSHIIDPLITVCDEILLLEDGGFVKRYIRSDFGNIEEELFGKLKTEAREVINRSI